MNRIQKLKLNSIVSLIARIVLIISGLIVPRLIISTYGAETHGLINSIGQFLAIITFLDMGVGVVVRTALYQPIAEKDSEKINSVLIAAKNYFKKIAYILIIYVSILIIFYPLIVDSTKSYLLTSLLIIAMSISHFGQYYLGIVNELLLSANQQDYVQLSSEILVIILNLIVSIILIRVGATIEIVKLGSSLVYLIRPLFLSYYVNKHFSIDYNLEVKEDPLPQKWSGMGQHVAYSVNNSTDIVALTLFSSLENISIYSVYNMVISAVKMLLSSLTSGIQSFFGNLYASDEIDLLNSYFDKIEWIVHTGVVYLFGMTAILINSFIMIYTTGLENISYEAPVFSLLMVLAGISYALRTPYNALVLSAGHFRETQMSSFIEAGLNIIISVILVNRYGLLGVAVGTLISMSYRTFYLVFYLSQNISFRPVNKFIKHFLVDIISFGSIMIVGIIISKIYSINTIIDWLIVAVLLGVISLILLIIINLIFYEENIVSTVKNILRKN